MANSYDIAQSDLAELLNVLGMGDHARPQSPHEVFQEALRVLRARLGKPAPDSTRTGAAETEDCPDVAYQRGKEDGYSEGVLDAAARAGLTLEYGVSSDPERHVPGPVGMLQRIAEHTDALAARPEAPSDAGWSREDLEAFVAREWPEGRSAGAAARELVRALGVRGLAPTLQRLLTDLLGQINFASTDRAQILADFANAAPEAARMAKIDSFERWNPRVFDPTPPSDPAPSGQAEG